MFTSLEKSTCGACLAGLLVLGFSQLSFAADMAGPSARQALNPHASTNGNVTPHDELGSGLVAHPELGLATPLALSQQRGNDRQVDVVVDLRMFKHLRAEKNTNMLPSQNEMELQESQALRSRLAKSAFAEALEKAKNEEDARSDQAARARGYLEAQQRQRYECIPMLSHRELPDSGAFDRSSPNYFFDHHCAPQVSGVPLTQQGLFPQ
jgi:hypothetical protein